MIPSLSGSQVSPADLRLLAKYHDNRGPADQTVIVALNEAADLIEQMSNLTTVR